MFKSLHIKNFRGIADLEINNLKKINLFVGENNSSKTSLLEALFMFIGCSNPALAININKFRNLNLNSLRFWHTFFHKLDLTNQIEFDGIWSKGSETQERILKIKPAYPPTEGEILVSSSDMFQHEVIGLDLAFKHKKTKMKTYEEMSSKVIIDNTRPKFYGPGGEEIVQLKVDGFPDNYKEGIKAFFFNDNTLRNFDEVAQRIGELQASKKLDEITSVLQKIIPELTGLSIGNNNQIMCDIGLSTLVPINILGNGIIKILSYLSVMPTAKDNVLLIDEIENGVYYKNLDLLWQAIFEAAQKYNVQIFATTHSIECVKSFSLMDSTIQDDVMLVRLEKVNNQLKAVEYSEETLNEAVRIGWEVR